MTRIKPHTLLPLAHLCLCLSVAGAARVFGQDAAAIDDTAITPFYQSWWFLCSLALAYTLLVHAVYRLRWKTVTRDSEKLLQELSERSTALENANEGLKQMSIEDALTGLLNRRAFDAVLQDECRRSRRAQVPLALMMLDIDYFKQFNDIYGHQKGDDCLIEVADVLKTACGRAGDFVARYGGEEIAVILPATSYEKALDQAGNLQRKVQAMAVPHSGSDVADVVTVSIGVACIVPPPKMQASELVSAADKALYRAKERGRNRVEYLDP